jgi:hypothetical protein
MSKRTIKPKPSQRKSYRASPRYKFLRQHSHAKQRNIPFMLTFDQWWRLWRPHWHKRGKNKGCLVMSRPGDRGGYELGNVAIVTTEANLRDPARCRRISEGQLRYHQERLQSQNAIFKAILRRADLNKSISRSRVLPPIPRHSLSVKRADRHPASP